MLHSAVLVLHLLSLLSPSTVRKGWIHVLSGKGKARSTAWESGTEQQLRLQRWKQSLQTKEILTPESEGCGYVLPYPFSLLSSAPTRSTNILQTAWPLAWDYSGGK